VALRGLDPSLASCTCPDFEKSELSTCKHIERVRAWYLRQPKRSAGPYLSLWWRPLEWPASVPDPLREIRCDVVDAVFPEPLREIVGTDGYLLDGTLAAIEAAIARAQSIAEASGLFFDVDPAVEERLAEARAHAELSARLGGVSIGDDTWREVVTGLGFQLHPYQDDGALFLARAGAPSSPTTWGWGRRSRRSSGRCSCGAPPGSRRRSSSARRP
jgi:hypothetical protein